MFQCAYDSTPSKATRGARATWVTGRPSHGDNCSPCCRTFRGQGWKELLCRRCPRGRRVGGDREGRASRSRFRADAYRTRGRRRRKRTPTFGEDDRQFVLYGCSVGRFTRGGRPTCALRQAERATATLSCPLPPGNPRPRHRADIHAWFRPRRNPTTVPARRLGTASAAGAVKKQPWPGGDLRGTMTTGGNREVGRCVRRAELRAPRRPPAARG